MLLCDVVAQGLIHSVTERDSTEPVLAGDKGKSRTDNRMEKAASGPGVHFDRVAKQEIHKALAVRHCIYSSVMGQWEPPGCCASLKALMKTFNKCKYHKISYGHVLEFTFAIVVACFSVRQV